MLNEGDYTHIYMYEYLCEEDQANSSSINAY